MQPATAKEVAVVVPTRHTRRQINQVHHPAGARRTSLQNQNTQVAKQLAVLRATNGITSEGRTGISKAWLFKYATKDAKKCLLVCAVFEVGCADYSTWRRRVLEFFKRCALLQTCRAAIAI